MLRSKAGMLLARWGWRSPPTSYWLATTRVAYCRAIVQALSQTTDIWPTLHLQCASLLNLVCGLTLGSLRPRSLRLISEWDNCQSQEHSILTRRGHRYIFHKSIDISRSLRVSILIFLAPLFWIKTSRLEHT